MAKKPTFNSKAPAPKIPSKTQAPAAKAASPAPVSTPVRATPVPKTGPKVITQEMIAKKAYEIWQSGTGGSEYDNWTRAERELRGS